MSGRSQNLTAVRVAIGLVAVAMVLVGLFRGEALEVFRKAAAICLQCIGIG